MAETSRFFFEEFSDYDPKAADKRSYSGSVAGAADMRARLAALDGWSAPAIHAALEASVAALSLKLGKVAQPLRVAASGGSVSPPIDVTLEILGREITLARLDRAIRCVETRST